jgi:hypothetical protein
VCKDSKIAVPNILDSQRGNVKLHRKALFRSFSGHLTNDFDYKIMAKRSRLWTFSTVFSGTQTATRNLYS